MKDLPEKTKKDWSDDALKSWLFSAFETPDIRTVIPVNWKITILGTEIINEALRYLNGHEEIVAFMLPEVCKYLESRGLVCREKGTSNLFIAGVRVVAIDFTSSEQQRGFRKVIIFSVASAVCDESVLDLTREKSLSKISCVKASWPADE